MAALCLLWPVSAHATPTINIGTYDLPNGQNTMQIPIYVTGGDAVQGVDLVVFTGDGGSAVGGTVNAPHITALNIIPSGGIFNGNNTGQDNSTIDPQFWEATTAVASGPPFPALTGTFTNPATNTGGWGLLAMVTIDATGFAPGSYSISVSGTLGTVGPVVTQFSTGADTQVNAVSTNGTIVVPEPASLGLFGLGIPAFLLRRRRN